MGFSVLNGKGKNWESNILQHIKIKWNWNFSVHKQSSIGHSYPRLFTSCLWLLLHYMLKALVSYDEDHLAYRAEDIYCMSLIGTEPASHLQSIRNIAISLIGVDQQSLQPSLCPPPWGFSPNTNHSFPGCPPEITDKQMDFAPETTLPELGQNSTCISATTKLKMIFFPIVQSS